MFLTTWCLATLVLAALLMGTSFAHTLAMPAKVRYDGAQWLRLQHTLYPLYDKIAAVIEIASIIAAGILAVVLRDWRPAMVAALAGTACLAVAFVFVWLMVTNRANARIAALDTLPADWETLRRRLEVSHAVRFALHLAGFALLVLATLISPLSDD